MTGNQRYGRQNYTRNGFRETLEPKAVKETGVGHMIGVLEVITEETIEALVTVD